jgi:L-alanine-DL-glutamate epimerase-like enolase superfamily enzyme
MKRLAAYSPWFIEEPTAPDDILGHLEIRKALEPYGIAVATGEQCPNMTIWKQLFKANAIDIAQVDTCRVGGFNEVLAILLMAAKFPWFFKWTDEIDMRCPSYLTAVALDFPNTCRI